MNRGGRERGKPPPRETRPFSCQSSAVSLCHSHIAAKCSSSASWIKAALTADLHEPQQSSQPQQGHREGFSGPAFQKAYGWPHLHESPADSFASVLVKCFFGEDRMAESVRYGTKTALKCRAIENPAQTLPIMEGVYQICTAPLLYLFLIFCSLGNRIILASPSFLSYFECWTASTHYSVTMSHLTDISWICTFLYCFNSAILSFKACHLSSWKSHGK